MDHLPVDLRVKEVPKAHKTGSQGRRDDQTVQHPEQPDVLPFSAEQPNTDYGGYGCPVACQAGEAGKFIAVDDAEEIGVDIFPDGQKDFDQMVLVIGPIIEE